MRDRVVWLAALAALLGRAPSALWPLRPDEAGFLLVARSWDPQPDSLYGDYWVDRPPQIIALVRLADWIGGPYFLRVVGGLACVALVLAAAATAREMALWAGVARPGAQRRVARWTAVVAAALVSNAEIDTVATKGELLGLPLVMASCWLTLRAVRHGSSRQAFVAGLVASLAVGMKQNIVAGLVFGAVVLVGSLATGRVTRAAFGRLLAAAAAGAAVPVGATVAWALAAGVRLETLWFTVVTFRLEAKEILESQLNYGPESRSTLLLTVFIATGMALVLVWFLVRVVHLWRMGPVLVLAVGAVLVVDGAGIFFSGSFWLPYLHLMTPGMALAFAAVMTADQRLEGRPLVPEMTRFIAGLVALSSVLGLVGWLGVWERGVTPHEVRTGQAIAAASRPGDTLVVYGGRADIQWASGLRSPYTHLWSLPMRTLDPGLEELRDLLTGPHAPTWIVQAVSLDTWTEEGTAPIETSLLVKYDLVVVACDRYRVYYRNTVDPVRLETDCDEPWRRVVPLWSPRWAR